MSDYVVFEEAQSAEFSCQTEEISVDDEEAQTVEETISGYKNGHEEEIAYWVTAVANHKLELERMRKINEKLEAEKIAKTESLKTKQAAYTRLFDLGNEKLEARGKNESKTDEEEQDTTTEDAEKS